MLKISAHSIEFEYKFKQALNLNSRFLILCYRFGIPCTAPLYRKSNSFNLKLTTMVIGHFGFGLGAKKFAPKLSLGLLFMAVQWADLLWPVLLLLGVEHAVLQPGDKKFPISFTDYPISHSLLISLAWGMAFGLACWLWQKDLRSAIVLGICVVSHWVLDLVVHKPDLPLFPGQSPLVGLGLWHWPLLTALVEFTIFGIGMALYLGSTHAINKTGKWSVWIMAVLLAAAHIAGITSPMPNSITAIGWGGQAQWLFVALGFWVDRNRVANMPDSNQYNDQPSR
jgi:hypothetical protein